MPITPLTADQLRRTCDPAQFPFATTAELDVSHEVPGQRRASEAIAFGVEMRQPGYNLFVIGRPGVGRRTLIERVLRDRPPPDGKVRDWCYVNNFADPQRPIVLGLPAGRGACLRDDLAQWVRELREEIPAAFDTDEYRDRVGRIDTEFNERQHHGFEAIGERATADGIALLRTPSGFSFAPMAGSEIMNPEQFQKLSPEQQHEIAEKMRRYEVELEAVVRQVLQWRRERAENIRKLNEEVVEFAVGRITTELRARYADLPGVAAYLDAARADVIAHVDEFRKPAEQTAEVDGMVVKTETDFSRYRVNAIVLNDPASPVPIVFEDHPTYANLVGRVEHATQFGALVTNFGLIRSGALHRANGGFLLVDAEKLLQQPYAWEGLKRAVRTRQIRIDSLAQIYSMISTISLEPEPIPLDVKVIVFGPPWVYALLEAYDPDFGALFKVAAEFSEDMPWDADAAHGVARLIASLARACDLRPFDRGAVAAIVEECGRLADDSTKLSVHVRSIQELLQQSDHWAGKAGRDTVAADDVRRCVEAQIERTGHTEDRMHEAVQRGLITIATDGAVVGQINGLAVYAIGRAGFGLPQRITATTRFGRGEVVDIHREIALSGAIHSKGVLTLSSFLATRFGRKHGLSLSATLSFEQSYGMIDGDSASVAELCVLVSSLSGVPLRQDCAVTGSIDQHGNVQPIGGVNEKIEGFFRVCRTRGLTGRQTVIIPQQNREHLMLRPEVQEAVREGRFHVCTVSHVDEALELLTGLPAGAEDARGRFPPGSVNAHAAARLQQFEAAAAKAAQHHAGGGDARKAR